MVDLFIYLLSVLLTFVLSIPAVCYVKNSIVSLFYKIKEKDKEAYERGIKILKESKPKIAIVIPTYNEKDVIKDTIEYLENNICYSNYIIIIADDSNDPESIKIIDSLKEKYNNILVYRRNNREGYKGGCLREVHEKVIKRLGIEYYYVFDCDWKPQPDFIEKTLPYMLGDSSIGIVQFSRRLKRDISLSQYISSSVIESAYTVDLPARYMLDEWILFTGSSGLLRTKAVDDAGGWIGHLTEDIHLSLRITLAGYRTIYLKDVESYGVETPQRWTSYIIQQSRWCDGTIDAIISNFYKIISSKKLTIRQKISIIYQLLMFSSGVIVFILFIFNILLEILYIKGIISPITIKLSKALGDSMLYLVIFYFIASILPPLTNYVMNHRSKLHLLPLAVVYTWSQFIANIRILLYNTKWMPTPKKRDKNILSYDIIISVFLFIVVYSIFCYLDLVVIHNKLQMYHIIYWFILMSPIISKAT